jgi:mannosyltransferase
VTAYVTTLSWADFSHLLHNQDLVHGLYYLFIRIWTHTFGDSVLALRVPSIIGMGVAAGGIAVLGRRLHSTPVGVAAGLIFIAIPTVSRYGEEARSYAWVVALVTLATLALLAALDEGSGARWSGYGLLLIMIVYLHVGAATILLPHAILAWNAWRCSSGRQLTAWLATAAVSILTAGPLLYLASRQAGQVDWITSDAAAVRRYPIELFGSVPVSYAIVGLGLLGAVRLSLSRPGWTVALLAWALLPPVFDYGTVSFAHLFLAKYALFTLPAWALLGAGLLAPAGRRASSGRAWTTPLRWMAIATGVVGLAAAGFTAQQDLRRSPLAGEPDFRAAAAAIDAGYRHGDGVVYVGTYRFARIPFRYELQHATPNDLYAAVDTAHNGWFYPQDCADPTSCLKGAPRIWLVVSNYSNDDFYGLPANEADPLRSEYHKTITSTFTNIRVVLLVQTTKD